MERDELDEAFDERCRRAGVVADYFPSSQVPHEESYVIV